MILAAAGQAALAPVGRVDTMCMYPPSTGAPGPIGGFGEKPPQQGQTTARKSFVHVGVAAATLMKYVIRAVYPGGYSDSQAVTAMIGLPAPAVTTGELTMTGLRFQSKSVTTGELTMTGLREIGPGERLTPRRRELLERLR